MNDAEIHIPESQERVLTALAHFRYLTTRQMINAGVTPNYVYLLNKVLPLLQKPSSPFIESHDFGVIAGKGRLSRVYCLTKEGALAITDERKGLDKVRYPIGGVQYKADYFHRIAYVDFCISFRKWIEENDFSILDELHYFDKTGASRRGEPAYSDTRLSVPRGHVIPDGLFFFDLAGKRRAVAVEIHVVPKVANIIGQLQGHFAALSEGAVSRRFGHDKGSLILSVFADAGAMERVKARLQELPDFATYRPFFRFALLEDLKADFGSCWRLADTDTAETFG